MTNEFPGYDAWKLSTPPYLDGDPPCTCGHEAGDHMEPHVDDEDTHCERCGCTDYTEYTLDDYREDIRERRAEYRSGY